MKTNNIPISIERSEINKILIIMLGGIGNLILIEPALTSLREAYPHAHITLLSGEPKVNEVFRAHALFDDVIVYDRRKKYSLREKYTFIRGIRVKRFDVAIAASGLHPVKTSLLMWLCGVRYRIGEDINKAGWFYNFKIDYTDTIHETDGMIRLVQMLGITVLRRNPLLNLPPDDERSADLLLKEKGVVPGDIMIGVYAGSGVSSKWYKCWLPERFAELCILLNDRYTVKIILAGNADDSDVAKQVAEASKASSIDLTGCLSIRQAAALIKRCQLFIGTDSGLMHIAAAAQVPSVVLWGPTVYEKIGPRGDHIHRVQGSVNCSPCHTRKGVICDERKCMESISVADVFSTIEKILDQMGVLK